MANHTYTTEIIESSDSVTVVRATSSDPMNLPGRYFVYPNGDIKDLRNRRISRNALTLREALEKAVRDFKKAAKA